MSVRLKLDDHGISFSTWDEARYRLAASGRAPSVTAESMLFDYPPSWRVRLFMLIFRLARWVHSVRAD